MQSPSQLIRANELQGPSDLYAMLLVLKNGFGNGSTLGHYSITKTQAKRAGISWGFLFSSFELLCLNLDNLHGLYVHSISL